MAVRGAVSLLAIGTPGREHGNDTAGKSHLSAELWAIIGVGVMLAEIGITATTLGWNMHTRLDMRLAALGKGQARIEGWIQGRSREGATSE